MISLDPGMNGVIFMPQNNRDIFENLAVKNIICHLEVCPPDWAETDCIYGYNKFYYFLGGEGTLIIEGDQYRPVPGEFYLIPADTRHTYYHNPKRPVYKYWCHFDLSLDEGKKLIYSKNAVRCRLPGEVVVPAFGKLVDSYFSKNPLDALAENAALLDLLRIFLGNIDYTIIIPLCVDDFATSINDYILRNIDSNITLKQLADTIHLHPNYFTQYFKKHFNFTPIEYVNILRLQRATQLFIHYPGKSIGEVALEVGFNDYRYFTKLFKKRYGITPSTYKRIH